jgi:glycosyltransferase involved in cell wall biosynthesis
MKLCFLAGANSIHSYRWIKYFAEKGHKIYWFSLAPLCFGKLPTVDFHGMNYYRIKALNIVKASLVFRRQIKIIKPDILHVHSAGSYGLVGRLSGFHPIVLTVWGSDVLVSEKSKVKSALVKTVLKGADLITCDAEHMKKEMIKLGVDDKRIKIVFFGTDIKIFRPKQNTEEAKNKLNHNSSPIILSLRSLEPLYDNETLIKTIPHVLKDVPDAKFVIAGTGSQSGALKKTAERLGVSDNVEFVGQLSENEVFLYLMRADIYVSTSLSDAGLAASTAEAMACQLPVIITDFGDNRKWVTDGEGGFIIPPQNPQFLAQKIIYLIRNEHVRKEFGALNRKVIVERNNYYIEMEKMGFIYQIIGDKKCATPNNS